MIGKANRILHHYPQQPRWRIFCRNPLLLKIVVWLGSLHFIVSTGVVRAEIQPLSAFRLKPQQVIQTSASPRFATGKAQDWEIPDRVDAPAASAILPRKIPRRQHTDLLTADNYTVSVNGADSASKIPGKSIKLHVPEPIQTTIPTRSPEIVTTTSSQIQPSYVSRQTAISRSVPEALQYLW